LIAGQRGKLTVIALGPAPTDSFDSSVAVVVRNNTNATVYNVSATGTARRGGALIGTGESQGFDPAVVHPGEFAFGYVYFGTSSIAGATFSATATADTEAQSFGQATDLTIAEMNTSHSDFSDSVVGIVRNQSSAMVEPPIEVWVLCLVGPAPQFVDNGFTDGDTNLAPNATTSFTVDLTKSCSGTLVVGSAG
jgi:hypothetical protein